MDVWQAERMGGLNSPKRRGRRRGVILILALGLLFVVLVPGVASAATGSYLPVPLASDVFQGELDISNERIVWSGRVGGEQQIFTWTATGGVTQLTSNPYGQYLPQISGDRIVWVSTPESEPGSDLEIYTWTPTGGTERITSNATRDTDPAVSGDRVVWLGAGGSDGGADLEVFTWTPGDGTFQVTADAYQAEAPQVSGDRAVWRADNEIYTWKAGDSVQRLTTDAYFDDYPCVSGDRVAWISNYPGPRRALYTWTPSDGQTQLTSTATLDVTRPPRISGDRIVFSSYVVGSVDREVFTWTPSGGVVQLSSGSGNNDYPQVDGDCVVWNGENTSIIVNGYYEAQVYVWTPDGGISVLGSDTASDYAVKVSNGRVAWTTLPGELLMTASAAHQIVGTVEGESGGTVSLAGATVAVSLSPSDPNYDSSNPSMNLVGTATTAGNGRYLVDASTFRTSGLPQNSAIEVVASMPGRRAVKQTGTFDRSQLVCSFQAFDLLLGSPYEDRRLPVDNGQGTLSFTHLLPNQLGPPPTITGMSRNSGPTGGGTAVVITGTGLGVVSGDKGVTLDGVDAGYTVDSPTQITVVTPPHVRGSALLQVNGAGGSSFYTSGRRFTFSAPVITSVSPAQGPTAGANTVTINGMNFAALSGAGAVKFGDANASSYTLVSSTQITAVAPAHPAGKVNVRVTDPADSSDDLPGDDYSYVSPAITGLSPGNGPTAGGTSVTITGYGFLGVPATGGVLFGDTPAATYTVLSSTQISAVTPPRAEVGPVRVQVMTSMGPTEDTSADEYRYSEPPPDITSVSPSSGARSGGTSVTIRGTSFLGLSGPDAVKFGDFNATSYHVVSSTEITAVAPPHVAGIVQVQVRALGGASRNTSEDDFTYLPSSATPDQFSVTRITNNSYGDGLPQVSGDRVVWLGAPDGMFSQIFTWTPATGAVQLTTDKNEHWDPYVSGDRVVWCAPGGSDLGADFEVFTWTPSGNTVQLTRDSWDQRFVRVSGNRVVWESIGSERSDICTWTPSGGTLVVNSGHPSGEYPRVSGDRVVWGSSSPTTAIYTWSPANTVQSLTSGNEVRYPDVSGNRVACPSYNTVFTWTPNGTQSIPAHQPNEVAVSGDRVAFNALAGGAATHAFAWTPAEGTTQVSAIGGASYISVSGDRVVWSARTGVDTEVFAWTPTGGTVQVTDNTVDDSAPAVSGNRMVWSSGSSSTTEEIYTAVITSVAEKRTYDDKNPNIVKTGAWADFGNDLAYNKTYARSLTPGASATVYFTGTKIAWIGMKGSTPGIVDVYLNDVWKARLDLYASPAKYQVPLFTSETLPYGLHHLDLVRHKDSLATEYLVLDAVDIWGGEIKPAPPTITSLSPASGPLEGGTTVTITGTSFTGLSGPSAVTFDGLDAKSYTVVSPTKITAVSPEHAAGSVRVKVSAAGGTTLDTAKDDFTYSLAPPTTRIDIVGTSSPTGITFHGTWSPYNNTLAYKGSYLRSSTSGAYIIITFKGTQLDWITMKGTTGGKADIYVDGSATKAATVNLYASPAVYQRNVWSTGTLPDGYHTVKLVRSGSSGYLTIDAVEVAGKLVPIVRTEDKPTLANPTPFLWNPAIGSWATGNTASASGGTYKYMNTVGASITFKFTGVSLSILAKTAPNYGNLIVVMDGVSKTVSLYSPSVLYRKTVWSSGFVAPGEHTVVIKRAGTKSASSSGYYISFDAADLRGEWR